MMRSRRAFLALASTAVGLMAEGGLWRGGRAAEARRLSADDPDLLPPFERLHLPVLELPVVAGNGAKVPIVVEMTHPMDQGHCITTIQVSNERDPVPSKGVFHWSPANGRLYLSFQARLHDGRSEVSVTAECNRHGRWSSTRPISVVEGAGGCAAPAPPARIKDDEIRPPALRIPELLKRGRIRPDEIVLVQLVTRHPNRTGLGFSRTTDGGNSWEPPRSIFQTAPGQIALNCQILVRPDGTVVEMFLVQYKKPNIRTSAPSEGASAVQSML